MPKKPICIRLSAELIAAIKSAALVSGLDAAETMRQALGFGLPIVEKKFAKKEASG